MTEARIGGSVVGMGIAVVALFVPYLFAQALLYHLFGARHPSTAYGLLFMAGMGGWLWAIVTQRVSGRLLLVWVPLYLVMGVVGIGFPMVEQKDPSSFECVFQDASDGCAPSPHYTYPQRTP